MIKTAYFGFEVADLQAWRRFGDLIGLQAEQDADGLFFRVDDRAKRLHFIEGPSDDIAWVGWEADDQESYDCLRTHLGDIGIATEDGDAEQARLRGVTQFFHFSGPVGVRHEIALGIAQADGPFLSGEIQCGFVTGDQGLGHVAFNSADHREDEAFMREALFARLSDYIYQPLPDGSTMHASFLHTGPRHHSIAFVEGLGADTKLNHFELELNSREEVESAYERLQAAGVGIGLTLGRHSNDRITSFYAITPSSFMVELGYGGLRIDDEDSWKPVVHDRISEWGHEFQTV